MISLKKRNLDGKGFTIVELLIVIVVIGILALLVITTYSGIQAKARNSQRQTDLQSVQTQLEAFFSENGYYPSLANMNSSTWLSANMKSLDTEALSDPSSANNSKTLCGEADGNDKEYCYNVTTSDGQVCGAGNDATNCAKYKLTATYEGTVNGQTKYQKSNLD